MESVSGEGEEEVEEREIEKKRELFPFSGMHSRKENGEYNSEFLGILWISPEVS